MTKRNRCRFNNSRALSTPLVAVHPPPPFPNTLTHILTRVSWTLGAFSVALFRLFTSLLHVVFIMAAMWRTTLLMIVAGLAAATATAATTSRRASLHKRMPGSCLVTASSLCAGAESNAMRCLYRLVAAGDVRVPASCAQALEPLAHPARREAAAGAHKEQDGQRKKRLARLLNEGAVAGSCGNPVVSNTCLGLGDYTYHDQCNDVQRTWATHHHSPALSAPYDTLPVATNLPSYYNMHNNRRLQWVHPHSTSTRKLGDGYTRHRAQRWHSLYQHLLSRRSRRPCA